MNDTENELLTSNYKAAVKIKLLQEALAEKDTEIAMLNRQLADERSGDSDKDKTIRRLELNNEALKEQLKIREDQLRDGTMLNMEMKEIIILMENFLPDDCEGAIKAKQFLQKLGEK